MNAEQLQRYCRDHATNGRLQWFAQRLGTVVSDLGPIWHQEAADRPARLRLTGVYFIQCGEFVKIGFSEHVPGRMKDLQIATPYELVLLRLMPGERALERQYHKRFAHLRHRLEWFRHSDDLREWLERPMTCMLTDPYLRPKPGPLPI